MRTKRYTERISVTLPAGVKARLKVLAKEQAISLSELMRRITTEPTA